MKFKFFKRVFAILMALTLFMTNVNWVFAAYHSMTITSRADVRIDSMLAAIKNQSFNSDALKAKVLKYTDHILFHNRFPAIGSGTFNYLNSGSGVIIVDDGTYKVNISTRAYGCYAYSKYVSYLFYGSEGTNVKMVGSPTQYLVGDFQSYVVNNLQAGEHIRMSGDSGVGSVHSVTFISRDVNGFYFTDYGGDSSANIYLRYTTYSNFIKEVNYRKYTLSVYNVNKTINTAVTSVTLPLDYLYMYLDNPNQTKSLKATINPSNASNPKVHYTSSDIEVASIDDQGLVTALSIGTTTITATSEDGGHTASAIIEVVKEAIMATSLKASVSKVSMSGKNRTYTIKTTLLPRDTTDKISYTSSNPSVVKVNDAGVLTSVKPGTATITMKVRALKTTIKVTVKAVSAKSIKLNKTSMSLNINATYKLTSTLTPSNATNSIKWSSSNSKIVKVSSGGTVTAIGKGTAYITAKTSNGKKTKVKITVKVPARSISLNYSTIQTPVINKTYTLKPKLTPTNSTDGITYVSSDKSIVTVSSKGIVTTKAIGTATITATTTSGKSVTCDVTVYQALSSLALDKSELTLLSYQSATLVVIKTPEDNISDKLTWTSANTKIATVSSNGLVTPIGNGETVITVISMSGKKATCVAKISGFALDNLLPITVEINPLVNQIQITDIQVNCRPKPTNVSGTGSIGYLAKGYYNIINGPIRANNYDWYEIEIGKWVAYSSSWAKLYLVTSLNIYNEPDLEYTD